MPEDREKLFASYPQGSHGMIEPNWRTIPKWADDSIVIEVGTNKHPDLWKITQETPRRQFLIALEPIEFTAVRSLCQRDGNGMCLVLPFAVSTSNGMITMRVTASSVCSSLLKLNHQRNAAGDKDPCALVAQEVEVPTITLDTLVAYYVPAKLDVRLLLVDAQGFDLHVASSLRTQRSRIANLILECQDLAEGDQKLLAANSSTCGMIYSCIGTHWKEFEFDGCWENMGYAEYNCGWSNVLNPLHDRSTRHPHNQYRPVVRKLRYPAKCPRWFESSLR